MAKCIDGYFVNSKYSFTIMTDKDGRKVGKLVDRETNQVLAEDMHQRVCPVFTPNLINAIKVIISAAWQDGKILPEERKAFDKAFGNVEFTEEQIQEIEKEFANPTPLKELLKKIKTREEKMLILETSLLLIVADKEFHPKEKEFIDFLVKEFKLDNADYALLYNILPPNVKQYIKKEKLHENLEIELKDIETLDRLSHKKKKMKTNYDQVYTHFVESWKNRSTRYRRDSVY